MSFFHLLDPRRADHTGRRLSNRRGRAHAAGEHRGEEQKAIHQAGQH